MNWVAGLHKNVIAPQIVKLTQQNTKTKDKSFSLEFDRLMLKLV